MTRDQRMNVMACCSHLRLLRPARRSTSVLVAQAGCGLVERGTVHPLQGGGELVDGDVPAVDAADRLEQGGKVGGVPVLFGLLLRGDRGLNLRGLLTDGGEDGFLVDAGDGGEDRLL